MKLTAREAGVARFLFEGCSAAETAGQLGLTRDQVKDTLGAIYRKAGIRGRSGERASIQLVALAWKCAGYPVCCAEDKAAWLRETLLAGVAIAVESGHVEYVVDQSSVTETVEYLDAVRLRIFEQVRLGMEEAMQGLGATAIEEMFAAGIASHTGQLAAGLERYKVGETREVIYGSISPCREMKLKGRTFQGFVATALDEGFHVPTVEGTLLQFTEPNEATLYSRGHQAFDVAPHPFLRAAEARFAPTLIEIIQERVAAATEPA